MTFRKSHLTVVGAAVLLLAGSAAAQEKEERTIEKRVIVIDGEKDEKLDRLRHLEHLGEWEHRLADRGMECQEEDGKKICVARIGPGMGLLGGTFLGVELTDTTPELREHLGGPRDAGVLVSRIEDESPAAKAGLRVGDIVTALDGDSIASARDLRHAIVSRAEGDAVAIELYRDGRLEQVTATLAKREPRMFTKRFALPFDSEALSQEIHQALEGIDLEDLDAEVREHLDSVDWEEIRETIREALDQALERDDR